MFDILFEDKRFELKIEQKLSEELENNIHPQPDYVFNAFKIRQQAFMQMQE